MVFRTLIDSLWCQGVIDPQSANHDHTLDASPLGRKRHVFAALLLYLFKLTRSTRQDADKGDDGIGAVECLEQGIFGRGV